MMATAELNLLDAGNPKSFDAREWAKQFVEHVRKNPEIPTDVETMTTWFAGALMRGYDERGRK